MFQQPSAVTNDAAGGAIDIELQALRTDFPCSIAQERFWLLDRLDPGASAYNVAVRWRLQGTVSGAVLEQAWFKIIERHEILRTVFLEVDGAPIQRVSPKTPFRMDERDLTQMSPEAAQAEGERVGLIEARAPFDLSSGPLLRVTLLRFSAQEAVVLVTTHQIVSDGWSIGVMAREMGQFYQVLQSGQQDELEPLPVQYADYSLWQLEWLRVRGTDAETAYWSKQLAGVKLFNVIPDHPRPNLPTTNGAIVSTVLPRSLTSRAQSFSADRGTTLFAVALGSLCAALARFTNETEIVLGTQVSDRDQVELEAMIGQFVNSLVLRNDLSGDPTFTDLIDRVRTVTEQALENRHIPIERLLGMMKGTRVHSNTPPISVNFIFQKTFIQNKRYAHFDLIDMPSLPAGAIYDLNFFMVERPDGWRLSCQYNLDQFDGTSAERLIGYVQSVLESALTDPQKRLSELQLASPNEARLLLAKLNDTRTLYPRELTLSKLFEAQAKRAPQAVAAVCGSREISYQQLNTTANRFAVCLQLKGVAVGNKVAVCMSRSIELLATMLALLKIGAVYVPVDANDPSERQIELIKSAGATAVVAASLSPSVAALRGLNVIDISVLTAYTGGVNGPSTAMPDSDTAACIVFKASSSQPQDAVRLSHRGLSNLAYSLAKRPGVAAADVLVSTAPVDSDRAQAEIFLALLNGARLVMPLDNELSNGRALMSLVQESGATFLYGSAQLWSSLLGAGWIGIPALKMLCSVRDLTPFIRARLAAVGGELWSVHGRTQSGIWSALHQKKTPHDTAVIGGPVSNSTLYVLDSARQITPVGAVGEIYVGGEGVSSATVADPLSMGGGIQLTPTGDRGRLLSSGQIEWLGNNDSLLSHHGRDIDPCEIERALRRDPAVVDAAVTHMGDEPDDCRLIAHIVLRIAEPDAQALTRRLKETAARYLPAQLVPDVMHVQDALPRTSDGDIDRQALVTPATESAIDLNAAPSDTEKQLASIWAQLLNLSEVKPSDNFFEIGGHSLVAARMLAQVEKIFGKRVRLAAVFNAPTLRAFAHTLAQDNLREFDFRQVVKIQPNGSKTPLIVVNNTGIYYSLAKCLGQDQPVVSLQLFDPSVRTTALPDSIESLAAGYVELIKRVQPTGPYYLMGWCVAGALAYEIGCQLTAAGEQVSQLFLMDSWVPRYLARLPRLRSIFNDITLRLHFIIDDWAGIFRGEQTLKGFLQNRKLLQRFQTPVADASTPGPGRTEIAKEDATNVEDYDQWLLNFLQGLSARYEPKRYPGKITLFRSRREPTGLWFDPLAGWGQFTQGGVELFMLDGNHFTMFQEPGVQQMATHISAAVDDQNNAAGNRART